MASPGVPPTGARLIRRMLRRHRGRLVLSYTLLSIWQVCEALVPVAIGLIIDRAIAPGDLTAFVVGAIALTVLMGVLSLSYRFGARLGFGAVQREQHALRLEIFDHVLDPDGARTGLLAGETVSVATGDALAVSTVVRQLGYAVSALVATAASAIYLLWLDVALGLLVLVGVPLIVAASQLLSPVIARRFGAEQAAVAGASGMATDLIQGMRPLKGVGAERVAAERYRRSSRSAERAALRTVRGWGALSAATTGLSGLLLAAVALLAGSRALSGELSLGEFVAIVGLTQFLAEPVSQLGWLGADAARSYASARRIADVLATPRLVGEGGNAPEPPYALELNHVSAGPLRDLVLKAAPGDLVGVVVDDPGASDAMVSVLTGERVPDSGAALLGGTPVSSLGTRERRSVLLVAAHRVDLFDGSVRFNVDPHGRHDDDALTRILTASAAEDLVTAHPDGLERRVRASGSLSGGQRQRIAFARALAHDTPVLLLQDPTSAVDSVTEEAIARGLRATRHGSAPRTTVVITSSPSLLAQADHVVLVLDGRTVATGPHTQLLERADYVEAVLR
ncbi:ABC transporter ATP-binding protein/permease [Mumia sp. zg.B53]|uniref:ABC transporter ATP-binding protein n=1 Tax=Mumia sp. zg.B53 TaxID=2855449 RepID=UPI001C6E4CCD|nr:ABC transporter ATP-binding protein [Mumia sp. zg.B53]MBW9214990.1 ABC transporter ATP-binding protein/permease [Mumia sp. zg.B53]